MSKASIRRTVGRLFAASLIGCLAAASGCASQKNAAAETAVELPAAAAPAAELAPLAFMTGRWVCVNPNKTVNDEMWTEPRGNSMVALFRQVRRDGKPALHEVSLITVEPDGVMLRLRHLHAALEIPKGREDVSVFKLVSAADNRAEFTGTGKAEQVRSVVYRLDGPDVLVQEVQFAEDSRERGYSLRYLRVE